MMPVTLISSAISGTIDQAINPNSETEGLKTISEEVANSEVDNSEALSVLISSSVTLFALGVIFAPIVEELVFRRGLIKQDIPYYFLVIGFIINTNFSGTQLLPQGLVDTISSSVLFEILYAFTKAIIIIGGFYILGKVVANSFRDLNSSIIKFGNSNVKIFVVLTSVLFALAHANNNGFLSSGQALNKFYLVPLIVIPQLVAGFEFAYLAIKFGLKYSVLSHSLTNFILVFLASFFSGLAALGGADILNNPNVTEEQLIAQGGPALIGGLGLALLVIVVGGAILFSWIYALVTFNKNLEGESK